MQCGHDSDATRRTQCNHDGMTTHITCSCKLPNDMLLGHTLLGYANGHILRTSNVSGLEPHRYQFSGAAVQWLLATPDGRTVAAGHACGLVVVFDAETRQTQDGNTCELQSEYKSAPARTKGVLSADGRQLLACTRREEDDVGVVGALAPTTPTTQGGLSSQQPCIHPTPIAAPLCDAHTASPYPAAMPNPEPRAIAASTGSIGLR